MATQHQPAPDPAPPWRPDPSRLRRSRADRRVAGVCGGLGRWVGVDPLLPRVLVVVLTLFGGTGLLLYGLAWLGVPEEGSARSEAQRLLRGRGSARAVVAVVAVLVGAALVIGQAGRPQGLVLLALVAGGTVLAVRHGSLSERYAPPPPPPDPARSATGAGTPSAPGAPGAPGTATAAAFAPHGPYAPAHPPGARPPGARPPGAAPPGPSAGLSVGPPPGPPGSRRAARRADRRARSPLGLLTVSVALVAVGSVAALDAVDGDAPDPVLLLAVALGVVGLGLTTSAFVGRARGLVPLGVLLAALLGVSSAAAQLVPSGGVGERVWAPSSAAELAGPPRYELAAGEATLDLRSLPNLAPGTTVVVTAEVGAGELSVQLPAPSTTAVELVAEVEIGELALPEGRGSSGRGNRDAWAREQQPLRGADQRVRLVLDLRVGLGELRVLP